MKKVLTVVVLLLLASQVMAATTITAVKNGSYVDDANCRIQPVSIIYTTDVDIRGFALDITINHGSLKNIRDFNVGESNGAMVGGKSGYGIFPSRFRDFVNPVGPNEPNWKNTNYNPTPAWNEPGTIDPRTGLGFTTCTVEMGTLFQGDANKPALSGTLFTIDVNSEYDCNAVTLTIAANSLRGNIVGSDANAIAGVVFNGITAIDAHCGCIVPNVVNTPEASATAAITAAGFTLGTRTTAYSATIPAGNIISTTPGYTGVAITCGTAVDYVVSLGVQVCTVPNVVNQLPVDANTLIVNAGFVVGVRDFNWSATIAYGKVMAQSPAAGTTPACGSAVNYTISRGPTPANCFDPCSTAFSQQKAQFTSYVNNKWDPNMWCQYPIGSGFQCHGDADGKATVAPDSFRIYTADLTLVTTNWKKKIGVYPLGANPAADIDHKATTAPDSFRVYTNDLARLTGATTGNWKRKGCTTMTGTNIPRNCPLTDAKNNAYVKPVNCNEAK